MYPAKVSKLSLTRRASQSFYVGDNIRITVDEVRGKQVRMKIEAPRDIPIVREEKQVKSEPPKM